jgi:hypothetical protein
MVARITKYLNKYVHRGLCLIYIFSFLFLEPSVSQKNAKKQCAVLPGIFVTVLDFRLAPQVLWNDLRGIVIK